MTSEMFINLLLISSLAANALSLLIILYFVAKFKIIKTTIEQSLKDNKRLKRERDQYREHYEYYYKQFSTYIDKHHTSVTKGVENRKEERANSVDRKVISPASLKGETYNSYKAASYSDSSNDMVEQALRISLLTSPLTGYDSGNACDFVRAGVELNGGYDSGSSSCSSFGD